MKKISKRKLARILKDHKKWRNNQGGKRANFTPTQTSARQTLPMQTLPTKTTTGQTIPAYPPTHTSFKHGDLVTKTKGSQWTGFIVGWYSTKLNPEGYAVESLHERGSVQIYPAKALTADHTASGKLTEKRLLANHNENRNS